MLVAAGAGMSAHGQAPEIEPREAAATAPAWGTPVWETHIAAGVSNVIAVFNQGYRSESCRVGYAVCNRTQGTWGPRQTIGGDHYAIDSSIAFDNPLRSIPLDFPTPLEDKFVAAALNGIDNQILVSRYAEGAFEDWEAVVDWPDDDPPDDYSVDKPWIVAGEVVSLLREYYIVYWHAPPGAGKGYAYLRSTDGGASWYPGPNAPEEAHEIWVGDERITGGFCAQPAAAQYDGGPLYIAFPTGSVFRFLRGDDRVEDGGVDFSYLETDSGLLEVPLHCADLEDFLPELSPFTGGETAVTPQLVVDPKNPDRLYVVYHDTVDPPPDPLPDPPYDIDVDVFLTVLERSGSYWYVAGEPRIRVNNDPNDVVSDQYLPAVTVDTQGRIHIIFYDDRSFADQNDQTADPVFDAYYAYAPLDDLDFQSDPERNRRLYAELDPPHPPDPPALDFSLDIWEGFEAGEYIGITSSSFGVGRREVWTSFTGTLPAEDPHPDEVVIWSSLIEW